MKNSLNKTKFWTVTFLIFLGFSGFFKTIHAQGTANIQVTGIPSIIKAPFTDQINQNFRSGRYQAVFTYNNSNSRATEFRFKVSLSRGGKQIISVTSDPKSFKPGAYVFTSLFDDIPFPQKFKDVIDHTNKKIRTQVLQEGTLPEGHYLLKIKAIPVDNSAMIASAPSVTPFTVRFPQPPRLINPTDQASITMDMPVFNWTPITGIQGKTIQYDFLLVEVLPHQTPLQALNSNRAIAQKTVINRNTLVYTPQFLPLEQGNQYVWRIIAHLPNSSLPIKNEGESEFHTFTYKAGAGNGSIAGVHRLNSIPLVPNFANLTNLDNIKVTEKANTYVLNGKATLQLRFNAAQPMQLHVQVKNLQLQKGSLSSPVLMGGSLSGSASNILAQIGSGNGHLKLDEVQWKFGQGVTASASLTNINGNSYKANGTLKLNANGASGMVHATGKPLLAFSKGVLDLSVRELQASLPEGTISGKGKVNLLGDKTGCGVAQFALIDNKISATYSCDSGFTIPLIKGSNRLQMNVNSIGGSINADLASNALHYNLKLDSSVGLLTEKDNTCGIDALVTVSDKKGFQIKPGQQRCSEVEPQINLGFIKFEPTKTVLNTLAYNPSTQKWNFDLNLSAKLQIPAFGSWKSYRLNNIRIDNKGIHFKKLAFGKTGVTLPKFKIHDFGVQLKSLKLHNFTFPLFGWNKKGPGPWDLSFSGQVSVPGSENFPKCVRNLDLSLTGGKVNKNNVLGSVGIDNFHGCTFQFGQAGYGLNISSLSGKFGVKFQKGGGFKPVGKLNFGGSLSLKRPFSCKKGQSVSIGNSHFTFSTGLSGTINNVIPPCDVELGPFSVTVTNSKVHFSHSPQNGNQASMQATAQLTLPKGQKVQGAFKLDMMTGKFSSVSFDINQPFKWNIPQDNPVLTFNINRAHIDKNGFLVDGRQKLLLKSGAKISTTFDSLNIDLQSRNITKGRVIFDSNFGLQAGINPTGKNHSLSFKAVKKGKKLNLKPGLYMSLPGQLIIDSDGLHTSGSAKASLSFKGTSYDSLASVDFSKDFALQLFPFKVGSGRADFKFKGTTCAYADPSGFHPSTGFFGAVAKEILPGKLPLPQKDIAYLKIRKNGQDDDKLLVQASKNKNGDFKLSTKAGQSLSLYAPGLDPDNSNKPPVLSQVTLHNVVVSGDPTNLAVKSGSITANVPSGKSSSLFPNHDVPLKIKKIKFGTLNNGPLALYLLGDLHLFNKALPKAQEQAAFFIDKSGKLQASVDFKNMNVSLPLLPQHPQKVAVQVDSINGSFGWKIGNGSPTYDFSVSGGLQINTDAGHKTGASLTMELNRPVGGSPQFNITNFDTTGHNINSNLSFGNTFALRLSNIKSKQNFSYSKGNGFQFDIAMDVGLHITPKSGDAFTFPIHGLEISDHGIILPKQTIDKGSVPGLSLPDFTLAGFNIQPLKLQTPAFSWNWTQGSAAFTPDVSMDFKVDLPTRLKNKLNLQDGITFNDVGLHNGYLSGSADVQQILGGADIPLIKGKANAPILHVTSIEDSLSGNAQQGQLVNINFEGNLNSLPVFKKDKNSNCATNATFSLSLVQSKYFEGQISGISPCGYIALGPAQLSVNSGSLDFAFSNQQQHATLSGNVQVKLPDPNQGNPITVQGQNVSFDLLTGKINSGSININKSFALQLPFNAQKPLFNFTVNQALLNKNGLKIDGSGSLKVQQMTNNPTVQFSQFQMGFSPFEVTGGSASISAGLGLQIGLGQNGLALNFKDPQQPLSISDGIDMDIAGGVSLNKNGLGFNGNASAEIKYQDTTAVSLAVNAVKDSNGKGFRFNLDGSGVHSGIAKFINGKQNTIATLSKDGFNPLFAATTLLPKKLGLPTTKVAYIRLKDQNGNPKVKVTKNSNQGYTISTKKNNPLPVVIPALPDQNSNPMEVDVTFSLSTDGSYHVNGGSLSLESNISLKNRLNLPLTLTQLQLKDQSGSMKLQTGLKVDLPEPLSGKKVTAQATIGPNGFSGTVMAGNYITAYSSNVTPLITATQSGTLAGSNKSDSFDASLYGVKITFGNNNTGIHLAGAVRSSLIMDQGDDPVFYTAGYSNNRWDFDLDPGNSLSSLKMGKTSFALNQQNGLGLHSDQNSFYLVLNGTVSLQQVLNDPLEFSVQNMEVGVDQLNSTPELHFKVGQTSGQLASQSFNLFDGTLTGTIKNPTLALQGRALSLSSSSGHLNFLKQKINYTNISISTDGGFDFGKIKGGPYKLIGNNLKLQSVALQEKSNGLKLTSQLKVKLPKPVDKSATTTLSIYRDNQGNVKVDAPQPSFNLNKQFALGNFGYFKLTQVAAQINPDPNNWKQSGIYANGKLYKNGKSKPIVTFGGSGNITSNPGIGISPSYKNYIAFNAKGNTQFTFDMSIFSITVGANKISAKNNKFQVTLSGQAGINLKSVSGHLGYKGFVVNEDGIKDEGCLDGSGDLDLAGIATLKIGKFRHKVYETPKSIKMAKTSSKKPSKPKGKNSKTPTETKQVKELLCFGPCPAFQSFRQGETGKGKDAIKLTISGSKNKNGHTIGGGVHSIYYYRTTNDERALYVKGLSVKMGKFLSFNASFNYHKYIDGGILLRAAAAGKFEAGNASAGAALAGKFYKHNGKRSYGLFVAVQASIGVPIVPGVVTMMGIGGGYFYRPTQEDFDNVTSAMSDLDYNPEQIPGQSNSSPNRKTGLQRLENNGNKFAAFLYAGVSLVGQGKGSVVQGSMFIAVTSSGVFMDARGSVLGMKGSGNPALSLQAGMDLTVQWKPRSYVGGAVWINLKLPPNIIKGTGKIEFFVTKMKEGEKPIWGIIGKADFDIVKKLHANAQFMVGNPEHNIGFLIDGKMSAGFSIPIITLKASVETSVWWFQDANSVKLPFGAYVKFKAKACVLVCITATAKGAMAKTHSGFKIYAAVKGCVDLKIKKACVAAWASIKTGPFKVKAGLGKGGHSDLIAQANQQRKSFKKKLKQVKNEIAAAKGGLKQPKPFPGFGVSAAEVRKAGANLYSQPYQTRWNLQHNFDFHTPSVLDNKLANDILLARKTYKQTLNTGMFSTSTAKQDLTNAQRKAKSLSKQVKGKLAKGLEKSIKAKKSAAKSFDKMFSSMTSSPVTSHDQIDDIDTSSANAKTPSFHVDGNKAKNQRDNTNALDKQIKKLDKQYRQTIASVDSTLGDMQGLLKPEISGHLNLQRSKLPNVGGNNQSGNQKSSQDQAKNNLVYKPGVQDLTKQYAKVLSLMRKYYALEANKRWLDVNWARGLRSKLHQNSSQIQSGIQTLGSNFNSAMAQFKNDRNNVLKRANYRELVADVANMNYYIKRFSKDNFYMISDAFTRSSKSSSAPQKLKQSYDSLKTPWKYTAQSIRNSVNKTDQRFWYKMHDEGLLTYANAKAKTVNNVSSNAGKQEKKLLKAYRKITGLLDKFYTNKAALSSILYNMIDDYLQWRNYNQGSLGNSGLAHYQQRKQELSDALKPPHITSISADPNLPSNGQYNTYFNKTHISWNATQPIQVIENSVDVRENDQNTNITVGRSRNSSDYVSVGNNKSITVYPYKRAESVATRRGGNASNQQKSFYDTRRLNVGVRVRGTAGNTAVRRAKFKVKVGPNGQSVSSGSNVLKQDNTAPDKPSLGIGVYYNHTNSWVNEASNSNQQNANFTIPNLRKEKVFWTPDSTHIKLYVLAHDNESGIATYEYAVGSSRGGTDIIDWSEMHGKRQMGYNKYWTSTMHAETKYLRMQSGKPYYVSVRVTNDAGKTSPVEALKSPVIYDGTAPTEPKSLISGKQQTYQFNGGQQYVSAGMFNASSNYSYNGPVDPVLQTVPPLKANINSYSKKMNNSATPNITQRWIASTDKGSGIKDYKYIISSSETINQDDFNDPDVKTTTDTHIGHNFQAFDDTAYVYVQAVDYAGNKSYIHKFGPVVPQDPTQPKVGKMQVKLDPRDLKLYYTEMPIDPETNLKGVQYAVGTKPGKTNVRGWPKGNKVDFKIGFLQLLSILSGQKRYVTIPTQNLPVGKDLYISYRVLNGQDMKSNRRVTGPVNLDRSQPNRPNVDLTYSMKTSKISIDVSGVNDPESGIKSVGYMVFYNNGYFPQKVKRFTEMKTTSGTRHGSFELSTKFKPNNATVDNYTDYSVRIILTNGAGLQRSLKVDLTQNDLTGGYTLSNRSGTTFGF